MSSIILVVMALAGIGVAWLTYFRFSHETTEFFLLIGLTALIVILLIVATVMPGPTRTVQTAGISPTPVASPSPETTSPPEATIAATEPTAPSTATATIEPTITATILDTPTVAATPTATTAPPTPTTAAATATPTTNGIATTVISSAANIRNAPGPQGTIVGTVLQGTQLLIIAATEDWYFVRLGPVQTEGSSITTGQGWIAQALVNTPAQTVPTITPTPQP